MKEFQFPHPWNVDPIPLAPHPWVQLPMTYLTPWRFGFIPPLPKAYDESAPPQQIGMLQRLLR